MADLFSDTVPIAADGDPVSSHAAGDRHTASGARGRNCRLVLRLVQENPGLTSVELFHAQGFEGDLDRHEVSRRLSDLWQAGHVNKGPMRDCSIKRARMVTWFINKGA